MMKKTAIFSAAILGVSMMSFGAVAQTATKQTIVPGSDAQRELQNAESRDDVADNPGMGQAEVAQPESQTIVPGSESQREIVRAQERDSVASGDDAMATGAVTTDDEAADGKVLVPGSGANFSAEAPDTQKAKALQDDSPASQTQ
ncbi:hypothetical protein [Jiella sonneratiae]|uniref:Uncharacterized protein n=1 Tax=Jiella sonneratiae TaxID=2816856 RepID=A0ABS3J1X4_9HYPH|nr:hypothetical protein [Jiella sonneratiae]MBO0903679.1 hypothetical protein [Jiella sonneratiae]